MTPDVFNYELLLSLTRGIPMGLDRSLKPEVIGGGIRRLVLVRDHCTCQLCARSFSLGQFGRGDALLHHIIPNGKATDDNLITLCNKCHAVVHLLLFTAGKWRFVRIHFKKNVPSIKVYNHD